MATLDYVAEHLEYVKTVTWNSPAWILEIEFQEPSFNRER
jgi:hypothetical protein